MRKLRRDGSEESPERGGFVSSGYSNERRPFGPSRLMVGDDESRTHGERYWSRINKGKGPRKGKLCTSGRGSSDEGTKSPSMTGNPLPL